jgi:Tfp pilus assembly protein PilV
MMFKNKTGFTLIEVLLGFFLISVLLCAWIQIHFLIVANSQANTLQTIAFIQGANLKELLYLNQRRSFDNALLIKQWQHETQKLLPNARSDYHCHFNQCHIHIKWFFRKMQAINLTYKAL